MKRIDCPGIGPRPIEEFTYGGEVRQPPRAKANAAALADSVFNRAGAPGALREWWHHDPIGRWFVLERDTGTDTVLQSIPFTEVADAVPTR